jgi:primase-polymerase (primpol)-like protein
METNNKVMPDIRNIPKELKSLPQWVCWRLEQDKRSGRDCKVPYSPKNSHRASPNNPATWGTLEEAINCAEKYLFSGIGFMFTAECGINGIDLDHCLESGNLNEIAADILAHLPPTYIEISPSGKGLHIFFKGTLTSGGNRNGKSGVEMYSVSRYFTVTGNKYPGSADYIGTDPGGVLDYIHKKYIIDSRKSKQPAKKSSVQSSVGLPDEELIRLAQTSKDSEAFSALWNGQWQGKFKSQSEADFALCRKLAFWSGRNAEQIDRLFRRSGLFREKWDVQHSAEGSTYGDQTITNACKMTDSIYSPPTQKKPQDIFEQGGSYYRRKYDKYYRITNFIVIPGEMVISDDETQLSCDFVTDSGEKFPQTLLSSDFSTLAKLKGVLNKNTIPGKSCRGFFCA